MQRTLTTVVALGLGIFGTLSVAPATLAETSKKDVLVASRALNFISPKPSGTVIAAIIYDPSNAASKADADGLMATIGSSLKAGKVTLSAKLVEINNLAEVSGAGIAFVTDGLAANHGAIANQLSGTGVLAASTDLACVQAGKCALGVSTSPKVEIFVNKAAAGSAGLEFLPAFLMMVKEV